MYRIRQRRSYKSLASLIAVTLLATSQSAEAVDLTWDGGGGANTLYDTAANWDPDQTPTGADNVTFFMEPGGTVILGAPSVADELRVSAGIWDFIGGNGTSLSNTGTVTIDAPIGMALNATPTARLNGPATWTTTDDAIVGGDDTGELIVTGGGVFTSESLRIGNSNTGLGIVSIDGVGSRLVATSTPSAAAVLVGASGTGELNLSAGGRLEMDSGTVNQPRLVVGQQASAFGTVNITGTGSEATIEDAVIGRTGFGSVAILDGGFLNQSLGANGDATLGDGQTASGSVIVGGDNSRWTADAITLGNFGVGQLDILSGGQVTANGNMTLGLLGTTVGPDVLPSTGNLIVSGAGTLADSQLNVGGSLTVGSEGQGTVLIDQGADATIGGDLTLGSVQGNTFLSTATIDGVGTVVDVVDVVFVGLRSEAKLEVTGGAILNNDKGRAGSLEGAQGTITVRDAGTEFNNSTDLFIGVRGQGTMVIENGGLVTGGIGTTAIGSDFPGNGLMTITGVDDGGTVGDDTDDVRSELRLSTATDAHLFVGGVTGETSGLGKLEVLDGGLANPRQDVLVGSTNASDGWIVVSGVNAEGQRSSILANDGLPSGGANDIFELGDSDGTGAGRLEVLDGGFIDAERLVANNGPADATRFDAGATPFSETILVSGVHDLGTPGDVSDDAASELNVRGRIELGSTRASSMRIEAGGRVISNYSTLVGGSNDGFTIIGSGAAADSSSVVITGADSLWADSYDAENDVQGSGVFIVGQSASGVTVDVEQGGTLKTGNSIIAQLAGSEADVTVTTGGQWEANSLVVGNIGSGELDVTDGGQVLVSNGITIASLADSDGGINVEGAGSLVQASVFELSPLAGSFAFVDVSQGGTIHATQGFNIVGSLTGIGSVRVGNFVNEFGQGLLRVDGDLNVGGRSSGSGGGGELMVYNEGLVQIDGVLRVYDVTTEIGSNDITSFALLSGGTIEAADVILEGDRGFSFSRGTLRYTGDKAFSTASLDAVLFNGQRPEASRELNAFQELAIIGEATLNLGFNDKLRINGGTLSVGSISSESFEEVDFDSGTLNFTNSGITVAADGIFGSILTLNADQTITTNQQLTVQAGSLLTVAGGRISAQQGGTNNGTLFIAEGNADFFSGFTNQADMVVSNAQLTGSLVNDGNLTALGFSTAGEVSLTDNSVLSLGINGLDDFDSLRADTLTLGGVLDLNLSGFDLEVGDSFAILEVLTSLSGTFDDLVDGAIVGTFNGVDLFIDYNAGDGNDVFLTTVLPTGITGDYNDDGVVDAADYTVWRANLGTGTSLPNDATPGSVTEADYLAWRTNYGMTFGTGSTAAAAVPEPTTLLLLLTAAGFFVRTRRPSELLLRC